LQLLSFERGRQLATRPQKITLGEMRDMGVRGLLVYCSDYRCSHSVAISADRWPDHLRLSDLEAMFVCQACGIKGADLRPDFRWAQSGSTSNASGPHSWVREPSRRRLADGGA
jgi:hypothetical protein